MSDTPIKPKLAYSVNEAADAVSVGRTSLFREIDEGRLVARRALQQTTKRSGKIIIAADDLVAWVKSRPVLIPSNAT